MLAKCEFISTSEVQKVETNLLQAFGSSQSLSPSLLSLGPQGHTTMAGEGGIAFFHEINDVAQYYRDLGRVQDELCDMGLALAFSGAYILWLAVSRNNHRVFKGIMTFIVGLGLLAMSFRVNRFPLAAQVLLAAMKSLIFGNFNLF